MIDLHTHSYYSDGTASPAEVVELAAQAGLTAVALSDHNTVAGLPEFLAAAEARGIEGVPAVEMSTDYGDTELHIVGLYIRPEHYERLNAVTEELRQRKERSNRDLVAALNRAGLTLDYEDIKTRTADGFVNRAVIGGEMVRLGYVASVKEAFSKWLKPELGYFQQPRRLEVFETIRLLRSMGAAVVLAHPFLNLNEEELRRFLPLAKEAGLDAMETLYSTYDEDTCRLGHNLVEEFGLLESGGSDFHGANKPGISVGTGRGELEIPDLFLERLKTVCANRKMCL